MVSGITSSVPQVSGARGITSLQVDNKLCQGCAAGVLSQLRPPAAIPSTTIVVNDRIMINKTSGSTGSGMTFSNQRLDKGTSESGDCGISISDQVQRLPSCKENIKTGGVDRCLPLNRMIHWIGDSSFRVPMLCTGKHEPQMRQ
jgi:hypothetical protein